MEIVNVFVRSKWKVFFGISILLFVVYGIDNAQYLIYNLDLHHILTHMDYYKDVPSFVAIAPPNPAGLFTSWFSYMLTVPYAFLAGCLVIRISIFFMVYRIADLLITNKKAAFIAALLFLIAPSPETHGTVNNGMWGIPIFFRSNVSALFTLIGIFAALRQKFMASFAMFAASIFVHSLYGVTACVFFWSGFLPYLAVKERYCLKRLLAPFLVLVAAVLAVLYMSARGSMGILPTAEVPFSEWHRYLKVINPDDAFLFWTLGAYGYTLIPILLFSGYVVYKKSGSDALRYLYIGGVASLFAMIGLECLHGLGLFMGKLSELFIITQFRRGVWVIAFFSILLIVSYVFEYASRNRDMKGLFLVSLFAATYLCPNILTVTMLIATMLIFRFSILTALLGVVFGVIFFSIKGSLSATVTPDMVLKCAVTVCITAAAYLIVRYRKGGMAEIFLLCILFFLAFASLNGISHNRFISDLKMLANRGFFKIPDHQQLAVDLGKKEGNIMDVKMVEEIRKRNTDYKTILYPQANATHEDTILFQCPIFINIGDYQLPFFSRVYYDYFMTKLKDLALFNESGELARRTFLDKYDPNQIDRMQESLTLEQLAYLRKKYRIGFIVTPTKYEGIKSIYSNDKYNLYDISEL